MVKINNLSINKLNFILIFQIKNHKFDFFYAKIELPHNFYINSVNSNALWLNIL